MEVRRLLSKRRREERVSVVVFVGTYVCGEGEEEESKYIYIL